MIPEGRNARRQELAGRLDEAGLKGGDPDKDGTLDAKEYAAVIAAKFKAADPDAEGTVDLKELDAPAGQALLKLIQSTSAKPMKPVASRLAAGFNGAEIAPGEVRFASWSRN